jgi:uncharacterized protein (DUF3820 family)
MVEPYVYKAMNEELDFGAYKGKKLKDIVEYDPDYLLWLHKTLDINKWHQIRFQIKAVLKEKGLI